MMEDGLAWLPWHPCHSCGFLGERASFSEIPSGKQVRSKCFFERSCLTQLSIGQTSGSYLECLRAGQRFRMNGQLSASKLRQFLQ